MKKSLVSGLIISLTTIIMTVSVLGAQTYTVQKGDTLWRIAKKYQVGISEIIDNNPQFPNPNLIYPGDKVNIPTLDAELINYQNEVLRLVNIERRKNGLTDLELDWQVSRVAQYKSKDMAINNYFDHQSPTYGSPFEMLQGFKINYKTAGENIAKGQKTPSQVVTAWMNSTGHRANILNPNYTHMGIGFVNSNNTTYWTQMFVKF